MGFWSKIGNTIGSLFGIKSQEQKEQEWNQGYWGDKSTFERLGVGQDAPFVLSHNFKDTYDTINNLASIKNSNMSDLQKQQLTMRKLFYDEFGYKESSAFENSLLAKGLNDDQIIDQELQQFNQKKINEYFSDSDNETKQQILSMQPKAIASLMANGYKTTGTMHTLADQEAKEDADKKTSTTSMFGKTKSEIWQDYYNTKYKDVVEDMTKHNAKAMEFAKKVNSKLIEDQIKNLGTVDEIKNQILQNSPDKIEETFNKMAGAANGLYAGTSDEEYRTNWGNDDLWKDLDGQSGFDKKVDLIANSIAISQIDPEAGQIYLRDALQQIAYDNTNFIYGIGKFGDHFVSTALGLTGEALVNAANSVQYRYNQIVHDTKEADRIQGNHNLGYTADWTEEKEKKEIQEARDKGATTSQVEAIHKKYRLDNWQNPDYWNKVSQYSTFSPTEHQKIEQLYQGVSPDAWVQAVGGPSIKNYTQDSADMIAQATGQYVTGKAVSLPFSLVGKSAAGLAKTVKNASKVQRGFNAVGETLGITVPVYGIAGSYSQNNFLDAYNKNLNSIQRGVEQTVHNELERKLYEKDPEVRDWFNEEFEKAVLNNKIQAAQYQEVPVLPEETINEQVLQKYYSKDSPFYKDIYDEVLNSDLTQRMKEDALVAAADASRFDNTTEVLKYGAFGMLFKRYVMPKNLANRANQITQKVENSITNSINKTKNFVQGKGFKAPDYGELGKIKTTGTDGIFTLEKPALNGYGNAAKAALIGGGFTNYTDELQSAWSQWWNNEEFKEISKERFETLAQRAETNPSKLLDNATTTYSLIESMNNGFMMGFDETGYNENFFNTILQSAASRTSLDAFIIGTFGSMMPGPNYRRVDAMFDGSRKGQKRFNAQTGLWEGLNIDPVSGEYAPLSFVNKLIGNRGWVDFGFNQARMQSMSEYNKKEHILNSFNQGLKDYVRHYAETDAPDLYELFTGEQDLLEAETPEEYAAIKASNGFKLAAFVGKAQRLIGDQSSDINTLLNRIEEIAQSETSDISDSEIEGYLAQTLQQEKIDRNDSKQQDKIESIKENIKQEYIEGAQKWLEQKNQIQEVYNRIDKTFGWQLTEDQKFDRAYKEINNPTWEKAAQDMEHTFTKRSKYTPMEEFSPASDFRTKEEVKEYLYGKKATDKGEPKKGQIEILEQLKEDSEKIEKSLKKAENIINSVSTEIGPEERQRQITKKLDKIKDETERKQVEDFISTYDIAYRMYTMNEDTIQSIQRDVDAARARLQYLESQPNDTNILSADEILKLSPIDRFDMIRNKKKYSVEQRKQITEATRQMRQNYKDVHNENLSEKKLLQLLRKQSNIVTNVELTKRRLENQDNYLFTAESERIATVNMAKQVMLSEFIPRVKNYLKQLRTPAEVYAYIYKMNNSGYNTASGFSQFLDYFKKYPDRGLEHVDSVIDSMQKAEEYVNQEFAGQFTTADDLKLLKAFVFASIERDKDLAKQQEGASKNKFSGLEDLKNRIIEEHKRAVDIISNLDLSYEDTVKQTQDIISNVEKLLEDGNLNSIMPIDNLEEALQHAVLNQNLKNEQKEGDKQKEKSNKKGAKKSKATSTSTTPPPVAPSAKPSTPSALDEKPKEPKDKGKENPPVEKPKNEAPVIEDTNTQNIYNKTVEVISNKNSFILGYIFQKLFNRIKGKLNDVEQQAFLGKALEVARSNRFKNYSVFQQALKDIISKGDFNNKPILNNLLNISKELADEAEVYRDKIFDQVISGENIPFVLETDRQFLIVPVTGTMQSANLIHLSQYERDSNNGVWHQFISWGGRQALRNLRPDQEIYFLRYTNNGESDIWLAVKDGSNNLGNGYSIVGLLSKKSNNEILKQQHAKIEALHQSDADGWEVIQKDGKPVTSKVVQKYAALPTTLKKEGRGENDNNYNDYQHESVKTLFEQEGLPEEKIIDTLLDTDNVEQTENESGHKYLRYRGRPILVKRINETTNKDGQLLQPNMNVAGFNSTTGYAAEQLLEFLGKSDILKKAFESSDVNGALEEVSIKLQNALGKALQLSNGYSLQIRDEGVGFMSDHKYSIWLLRTDSAGQEVEVANLTPENLTVKTSLGDAKSENGPIDNLLRNLIFDESGNFRLKSDLSNEPLVMWQVDHKGTIEEVDESIRRREVRRWLNDDLLTTSHLFLTPQIAGFTFSDPLNTTTDVPPVKTDPVNDTNVLPKGPKSAPVDAVPKANVDVIKQKMQDNYNRFKQQSTNHLHETRFARVTALTGKFVDMVDSAKALVYSMGNNLDTFFRRIVDKIIKKEVSEGEISSTLDLFADSEVNASGQTWKRLYDQFKGARDYIETNLINTPTGLEWVSPGREIQIAGWSSIEVRQFDKDKKLIRTGKLEYRGLIDALAYDPTDGQYVLFDYKVIRAGDGRTSNDKKLTEVKNKISKNKEGWARQLNLYAKALEETYGIKIKGAYIIPTRAEYPWDFKEGGKQYSTQKQGKWERILESEGEGKPWKQISSAEVSYDLYTEDITENLLGYSTSSNGEFLDWINAENLAQEDINKVQWKDVNSNVEDADADSSTSPTVTAPKQTNLNNKPKSQRSRRGKSFNSSKQATKSSEQDNNSNNPAQSKELTDIIENCK